MELNKMFASGVSFENGGVSISNNLRARVKQGIEGSTLKSTYNVDIGQALDEYLPAAMAASRNSRRQALRIFMH